MNPFVRSPLPRASGAARSSAAAAALIVGVLTAPHAHGAAVGCDAVVAAMAKGAATPSHQTVTLSGGPRPKPTQGAVVTVGGRMYVQAAGRWITRPYDPATAAADMRHQYEAPEVRARCTPAGTESVGGEAANVWQVHTENDGSVSDSRLWVSTARGLPLRLVIDLPETKARSESVWNYTDVRAPAGAD